MQWSDSGIILSARRLGESSGVIHLLTPQHGMAAGVDKGAFSSRKRGIYQPGNIVAAHWQARLPEHLGMLTSELTHATAAYVLDDRRKLAALTSATLMAEKMLSEREAQPAVHARMEALVRSLSAGGDWMAEYVRLEFTLLACTGFGLDLERCAATGQGHDLHYVSPKSGRAVSRMAGEPYREKLLLLPAFLLAALPLPPGEADFVSEAEPSLRNPVREVPIGYAAPHPNLLPEGEGIPGSAWASSSRGFVSMAQILDGLRLCGYFLEVRVFAPRGIPLPAVRGRFVRTLQPEGLHMSEAAG